MRKILFRVVRAGLLLAILSGPLALATERVLYNFPGGYEGDDPQGGVVFDSSGNLYGTTYYGGTYGWGTVYEFEHLKYGWAEKVLYSFSGPNDGADPSGNLLIDGSGNLYGTTSAGGNQGEGTVFELRWSNGSWKHIVLYNFCERTGCLDGARPSGLAIDKAGDLYGTAGGGNTECDQGCGVVYELTRTNGSWKETVLHHFNNRGDGYYPAPGVTISESGIYGATSSGGGYGQGIIFELRASKHGWHEVPLFAFDGYSGNGNPGGYLIVNSAGDIFGTTPNAGGCTTQCGSVFKLSRFHGQWVEENVYAFEGTNGKVPNPGLILGSDGSFYGSTASGGMYGYGIVFKLTPGKVWTSKILYQFTGEGADQKPNPGLSFGPSGHLFGTTPTPGYESQYDGELFEVW